MATKVIKSGIVGPNTVAINPYLIYVSSFNESIIKSAGFILKSVRIKADKSLGQTPDEEIRLYKNFCIYSFIETRKRYRTFVIKEDFVEIMDALMEIDPSGDWPIKEVVIVNRKTGREVELKVIGSRGGKKMVVSKMDGAPNHLHDVNDIMREVADLVSVTCYYRSAAGNGTSLTCESGFDYLPPRPRKPKRVTKKPAKKSAKKTKK